MAVKLRAEERNGSAEPVELTATALRPTAHCELRAALSAATLPSRSAHLEPAIEQCGPAKRIPRSSAGRGRISFRAAFLGGAAMKRRQSTAKGTADSSAIAGSMEQK